MKEYLTLNNNSNKKTFIKKGRIILNNANDLIKIPINDLLSIDVNTFSGNLYKKIYEEALRQENKKIKNKNNSKISEKKKNIKRKDSNASIKDDKNVKNNKYNKKSFHSRQKSLDINQNKYNKNNSPKEEKKLKRTKSRATLISQSDKNIKHNFNKIYNNNYYKNEKLKIKNNFENNNKINNLRPFNINDNEGYKTNYNKNSNYNEEYFNKNIQTDNNIYKENNNYNYSYSDNINHNNLDNEITRRFYSGTINFKNSIQLSYNVKRINFVINYISKFGEEVGILGSIFPLGNWEQNRVIRLKWNNGHIWKGGIYVNNDMIKSFEFKFVILQDNKIKKWEPGKNNIFNYDILFNQIKNNKRNGFYDKYNYDYNIYNDELTLNCKWSC